MRSLERTSQDVEIGATAPFHRWSEAPGSYARRTEGERRWPLPLILTAPPTRSGTGLHGVPSRTRCSLASDGTNLPAVRGVRPQDRPSDPARTADASRLSHEHLGTA